MGRVVESRKGKLEGVLLALVGLGSVVLPLAALFSRALTFADYPLRIPSLAAGTMMLGVSLWLFRRAHRELGPNWSVSLEVRHGHTLVTSGVYAHIRHPMYAAFFAQAMAQCLLLPNWIAGPAYLAAFTLMFGFRIGPEERMMHDTFGGIYAHYVSRTNRLIPRLTDLPAMVRRASLTRSGPAPNRLCECATWYRILRPAPTCAVWGTRPAGNSRGASQVDETRPAEVGKGADRRRKRIGMLHRVHGLPNGTLDQDPLVAPDPPQSF
jgi:protein-S-isoprenylcysteine O-methyltransferase Ste14